MAQPERARRPTGHLPPCLRTCCLLALDGVKVQQHAQHTPCTRIVTTLALRACSPARQAGQLGAGCASRDAGGGGTTGAQHSGGARVRGAQERLCRSRSRRVRLGRAAQLGVVQLRQRGRAGFGAGGALESTPARAEVGPCRCVTLGSLLTSPAQPLQQQADRCRRSRAACGAAGRSRAAAVRVRSPLPQRETSIAHAVAGSAAISCGMPERRRWRS